jgi:hypothetical protein
MDKYKDLLEKQVDKLDKIVESLAELQEAINLEKLTLTTSLLKETEEMINIIETLEEKISSLQVILYPSMEETINDQNKKKDIKEKIINKKISDMFLPYMIYSKLLLQDDIV